MLSLCFKCCYMLIYWISYYMLSWIFLNIWIMYLMWKWSYVLLK